MDLDSGPGVPTVGCLEDGSAGEAFQGDVTDPIGQELDLPAPLPQGELITECGGPVHPGSPAVLGTQHHRADIVARRVGDGCFPAYYPAMVSVGEVGVNQQGRMR